MRKTPRTQNRHESRRQFLKAVSGVGGVAVLPVGRTSASGSGTTNELDTDRQSASLLPADRTYSNPPQIGSETARSGSDRLERDDVGVDPAGRTYLDVEGGLDGEGRFGLTCAPTLETTWTAPRTGEYVVRARYQSNGRLQHDFGLDALVSSFPKTTLAVIDDDTGARTARTFLDFGIVGPDLDEFLLERGVQILASRLIPSFFGPFGPLLSAFLLGPVIDWIIPDPSGSVGFSPTYKRQLRFWAQEGHTYRIRFYSIAGGAGASRGNEFCGTRLTVETDLRELVIYPVGFSMPHELVVSKEGTPEGLGVFAVTVDDDLALGKDSEAEIEGRTALDWVGPQRGTDRLRYSGAIEEFLLKGYANTYRDGTRIETESRSAGGGENLPNTLTVTKDGSRQGLGAFMVAVDGELEPFSDSESVVVGSRALDWVGPERGTDRIGFSGTITDLVMKGHARIYVNGHRINPDAV